MKNHRNFFKVMRNKRTTELCRKKLQCVLLLLLNRRRRAKKGVKRLIRKRAHPKKIWVKIGREERRKSEYHLLIPHIRLNDHATFVILNGMTPAQFDSLLGLIGPVITRQTTTFRDPISAGERLSITLRYLKTGDTKRNIANGYRIGKATACILIYDTCKAISSILGNLHLKYPSVERYAQIAETYREKYGVPNCCGAITTKEIWIRKEANMAATKQSRNVLFLACCDTQFKFTTIDVETLPEAFVSFHTSSFAELLETWASKLPEPAPLPGSEHILPYYFIANEDFPLKDHTMRPYPLADKDPNKKNFNTKVNEVLTTVENAMGVMCTRWNVLQGSTLIGKSANIVSMVKATCCLHNFMISEDEKGETEFKYIPEGYADCESQSGQWRAHFSGDSVFVDVKRSPYRSGNSSTQIRDTLMGFLSQQVVVTEPILIPSNVKEEIIEIYEDELLYEEETM